MAEFPRYWDSRQCVYILGGSKTQKELATLVMKSGDNLCLQDKGAELPFKKKSVRKVRIIKLPRLLRPTKDGKVPANLSEFIEWLDTLGSPVPPMRVAETFLEQGGVIVQADNGWVGALCELPAPFTKGNKTEKFRPIALPGKLLEIGEKAKLIRLLGVEADHETIVSRNLGQAATLARKKVVLIGCGTVGSHLARFLVQNGAGMGERLTLIDPDTFAPANIGRHVLEFEDIGRPKVDALAEKLKRIHPGVEITPLPNDVLKEWARIRSCDLIIDATGDENVSDAINARAIEARAEGRPLSVLHAWVWGEGIAAQAFLSDGNGHACYRCLRPLLKTKDWRYDPRKDVNYQGVVIAPRCSDGAYVPFSVAAPAMCASLALELALSWASGNPGHRLRTVCLDKERTKSVKPVSPQRDNNCPACGVAYFGR